MRTTIALEIDMHDALRARRSGRRLEVGARHPDREARTSATASSSSRKRIRAARDALEWTVHPLLMRGSAIIR